MTHGHFPCCPPLLSTASRWRFQGPAAPAMPPLSGFTQHSACGQGFHTDEDDLEQALAGMLLWSGQSGGGRSRQSDPGVATVRDPPKVSEEGRHCNRLPSLRTERRAPGRTAVGAQAAGAQTAGLGLWLLRAESCEVPAGAVRAEREWGPLLSYCNCSLNSPWPVQGT